MPWTQLKQRLVSWLFSLKGSSNQLQVESSENLEAKATYLDAMDAIADHTNSTDLKATINEMRRANGIPVRDDNGNISLSAGPVNYDLPVGLENIGNTCYLNSLLQYLFTVKPVRDIALNYEAFKLELDDEHIKARLLGGNKMQMDRGEAVVAQACMWKPAQLVSVVTNMTSCPRALGPVYKPIEIGPGSNSPLPKTCECRSPVHPHAPQRPKADGHIYTTQASAAASSAFARPSRKHDGRC